MLGTVREKGVYIKRGVTFITGIGLLHQALFKGWLCHDFK